MQVETIKKYGYAFLLDERPCTSTPILHILASGRRWKIFQPSGLPYITSPYFPPTSNEPYIRAKYYSRDIFRSYCTNSRSTSPPTAIFQICDHITSRSTTSPTESLSISTLHTKLHTTNSTTGFFLNTLVDSPYKTYAINQYLPVRVC